jgi:hypothetical protein
VTVDETDNEGRIVDDEVIFSSEEEDGTLQWMVAPIA